MGTSTGSLAGLRSRNRVQVLDVLRQRGTASRADVAQQTGLATTTVCTLVGELLEQGVVVELPPRTGRAAGAGRPARLLAFHPTAGGAVGVHLAHNHIRAGLSDLAGNLLATLTVEFDVDHEPQRTLDRTARIVAELIETAAVPASGVVGIGVAVSAPVAVDTRSLDSSRILPHWRGVDLTGELEARTGLRVELGNDANLGAIAEHRVGVGQGVDHLVYVMLSDGVGAGLILNGRLYEGAVGGAGELGHVTVITDGLVCRCGNRGCLETVAGAPALAAALAPTRGPGTTLLDVLALAQGGDDGARRLLADAGRAVGRSLLPICTVLDLALVVIGGECSASDSLIDGVREELTRGMTPLRTCPISVRPGSLGEKAEMLGAIALATQRTRIGSA